jgi:hypothetical protein
VKCETLDAIPPFRCVTDPSLEPGTVVFGPDLATLRAASRGDLEAARRCGMVTDASGATPAMLPLERAMRNILRPESTPVSIREVGDTRYAPWGVRAFILRDHLENELRTMAAHYGLARCALEPKHPPAGDALIVGVTV